jgi:hypothetical protein
VYHTYRCVLVLTAWLVVFSLLAMLNSHVRHAKPIEQVTES